MQKYQNLCKVAIVILIWNGFSALATVYDSDGSSANIQSIHDTLAQNGDTITLPAGMIVQQGQPVPSEIIPDGRLAPWQGNVGVPGGIPTRTTIYKDIVRDLGADPTGQVDAGPILNSAINSCPPGQVVYIPAGTFKIALSASTFMRGNYSIRGAGQGQTILKLQGNANIYIRGNAPWPPPSHWIPVTAGATKGSNTITVSDASGFNIDQPIIIGPNVLPTWAHNLGGFPDTDRSLGVNFKVRSKTATTVTFDPPCPFDMSGMNPMVLTGGGTLVQGIGVESLTIDATNFTAAFPLEFENCWGSWIYDVEVLHSAGRQMFITNSQRCEVRHCYTHDASPAGPNHEGITLSGSWNLVEDNVCNRGGAMAIIFSDGGRFCSANVVAYNYITNTEDGWWDISFCHGTGSWLNLAEGNVLHWYKDDGYFGSSSYTTLFRNRIDWQVSLKHFSNYYNVVGNILGTGVNTVYESSLNGVFESSVYELGYPNIGNPSYIGTFGPTTPPDYHLLPNTLNGCQQWDQNVKATIIRHGNWDSVNNAVLWDPNIPDHTIPNSLYLTQKPAWWDADLPWPAIGPDLNPMVGVIPAQRRFQGGASPTPSPTRTPSPTPTPVPSPTSTPVSPSPIPSPTPTAIATATATVVPTPSPSASPTPTPTATARPTATAKPRHTPRPRPSHAPG